MEHADHARRCAATRREVAAAAKPTLDVDVVVAAVNEREAIALLLTPADDAAVRLRSFARVGRLLGDPEARAALATTAAGR